MNAWLQVFDHQPFVSYSTVTVDNALDSNDTNDCVAMPSGLTDFMVNLSNKKSMSIFSFKNMPTFKTWIEIQQPLMATSHSRVTLCKQYTQAFSAVTLVKNEFK